MNSIACRRHAKCRPSFDKPVLSNVEGLRTNGVSNTRLGILGELQPADLVAVDFVRSIDQPQRARMRIVAGQPEVVADAGSTMRLYGPVDDLAHHRRDR